MKKTLLLGMICLGWVALFAQAKKPVTTAKTKPAGAAPVFRSSIDSFSYAIGLSLANFYKEQGVKNINNQLVLKALNDAKYGKALMNETQVNTCIMHVMQASRSEKAGPNKKAGDAYLLENKKKPGVITLPSGLQYTVLTEGTGPKPALTDQVKCHYTGSLIDGKVFESSYTNNQPATFPVGQVIRGWTEALQLMNVGSKWRLYIPSDMGYGDTDNGPIPAGSALIFDVELLEIVKP